jgi:dihydroorotate dehydrogenase electron transfer subunit
MQTKILENEKLAPGYYRLTLQCPTLARTVEPGQFVMLKVSKAYDPLLRRPFSIHNTDGERVQILYQVVGQGTHLMTQMIEGEELDILGPLGNGFSLPPGATQALLVGGGVGVAPLLFWAQELSHRQVKLAMFIGGKSKSDLLATDDFKQLGASLYLATEDGSAGHAGMVTAMLEDYLKTGSSAPNTAIFACGPKAMLAHVAGLAKNYKLPAQLSLDVVMACGVGACMGCVVATTDTKKYNRVCREGPVFDATRIEWE